MPCELIPLPDIEQTVARPAIYQILAQVFEITQLPKDTEIRYAGKRGTLLTPGSTMEDTTTNREAKFMSSNLTTVEVTEDYDKAAVQEIQPYSWDQPPIFLDPKLSFSLRPVYIPSNVTIEITYQHSSETEIRQWLSRMLANASAGRDIQLHDIVYTYPVPAPFTVLLEAIHACREATEGYQQTLGEYFDQHRSARMKTLSTQVGTQRHIVVEEKQSKIQGLFEFEVMPDKPEYIREQGLWKGSFTYKFSYQRPDEVLVAYPIAVHNQFLPEKFLKHLDSVVDYFPRRRAFSASYQALQTFSNDTIAQAVRPAFPYIQIPPFDDFGKRLDEDAVFPKHTATVLVARCFLDDDLKTLVNLNELGDVTIDHDILGFLRTEYRHLNKMFFSVFNVALYINGQLQPYEAITVSSDLTVSSVKPLSKRNTHHIRLSVLPEINQPLYAALKRLYAHPKAFLKVLASLNELLALDPDFDTLYDRTPLAEWMFTPFYRVLCLSHQGNLYSTGTNLDAYLTEMVTTLRNQLHLLTKLDPQTIQRYFEAKRRLRHTVMNAYILAYPIKSQDISYPLSAHT